MRHGHEMTEEEERLNGQREVKSESKRSPARLAEAQALGEKKKKRTPFSRLPPDAHFRCVFLQARAGEQERPAQERKIAI